MSIVLALLSFVFAGFLVVFALIWWRAAYAIGECMHRRISMIGLDYSTRPFELLAAGYYPVKDSWGFVESPAEALNPTAQRVRLTAIEPTMRLFAVLIFVLSGLHAAFCMVAGVWALVAYSWQIASAGVVAGALGFLVVGGLSWLARKYFVNEGIGKAR